MDAITVTASGTIGKTDRMVLFVTDQQKSNASNGINLLASMQLPRLIVNPLTNEVALPGEERIQFRINGVEANNVDIKSLQPSEVIRIEYLDNPGVRYGNADLVINYIVKRPVTGGSVNVELMNAVTTVFGNDQVALKLNHKKSEFGVIYAARYREFDKVWIEKSSVFDFDNETNMNRIDKGIPEKMKENAHNFTLNYSFLDDKNHFNATARYFIQDDNRMATTRQYTSLNPSAVTLVHQGSTTYQQLPSLDLYYSRFLENKQTLIFNIVGTYINSEIEQRYEETDEGQPVTNIISDINGEKYSIIGEGIYEKVFENNGRFTSGLKHTQAFAKNKYTGTVNNLAKMDQNETYLFTEYAGKSNNLSYTGGIGVSRTWFKQEGEKSHTDYIFRPKFTLQYNFNPATFIRLKGEVFNTNPSLASLSAVEQFIDTLQIRRGNPALKTHANYLTGLTFNWDKGFLGVNYNASYQYSPDMIMEEITRENNLFYHSYDNQKDWQKLNNELTIRLRPLKNLLMFSLTGGANNYWSNGNNYKHTYNNFYYRAELMLTYKKFMAFFQSYSAYNRFQGESLMEGESMQVVMLRYNHSNFSIGAGLMSPFSDTYKRHSENRNKYVSNISNSYINNISQMLLINFSWNFNFGQKAKNASRRMNNSDNDSGIMLGN